MLSNTATIEDQPVTLANFPVENRHADPFTVRDGRIVECDFLVGPDGKLIDLDASLPHTADEVEAAMHTK